MLAASGSGVRRAPLARPLSVLQKPKRLPLIIRLRAPRRGGHFMHTRNYAEFDNTLIFSTHPQGRRGEGSGGIICYVNFYMLNPSIWLQDMSEKLFFFPLLAQRLLHIKMETRSTSCLHSSENCPSVIFLEAFECVMYFQWYHTRAPSFLARSMKA